MLKKELIASLVQKMKKDIHGYLDKLAFYHILSIGNYCSIDKFGKLNVDVMRVKIKYQQDRFAWAEDRQNNRIILVGDGSYITEAELQTRAQRVLYLLKLDERFDACIASLNKHNENFDDTETYELLGLLENNIQSTMNTISEINKGNYVSYHQNRLAGKNVIQSIFNRSIVQSDSTMALDKVSHHLHQFIRENMPTTSKATVR